MRPLRRTVPLGLAALALLLLALLAGCAQPGDEADDDPLFGLCPQWAQGHGGQTTSALLTSANATVHRELGPADAHYLNRSLDLYRVVIERVQFTGNATGLELRALASDETRLSLRDYRDADLPVVPVVHLDTAAVGKEFDIYLSPLPEGATAAPAPASLAWTLVGDGSAFVEADVTYHYKVCGA